MDAAGLPPNSRSEAPREIESRQGEKKKEKKGGDNQKGAAAGPLRGAHGEERRPAPAATAHLPSQSQQSRPQPGGARWVLQWVRSPRATKQACDLGGWGTRPRPLLPAPRISVLSPSPRRRSNTRGCPGAGALARVPPPAALPRRCAGAQGRERGSRRPAPLGGPSWPGGDREQGQGDPRARAAAGSVGQVQACTC